ncbi:MAG TPA: LPD38 domain-containing protein [Planctomycetota bacterium]|nr:LPD38 domain-containing protein [Planctomycetota bacterium]
MFGDEPAFVLRRIDGQDVKVRRDPEELAPPFYLKSRTIITEKMQARADGAQVLGMLRSAGVKAEELFWTGLEKLLQQGKKVTKAEVLQHLDENAVRVEEVVGSAEEGTLPASPMRGLINEKQLPGGTDYRELLLTMSGKKSARQWELRGLPRERTADEQAELDQLERQGAPSEGFRSSHFSEPNILAHVRFNERTDADGKSVLFIEEVQSDWHQKGKKHGYGGSPVKNFTHEEAGRYNELASGRPLSEAEYQEFQALHARRLEIDRAFNAVPNAPFKKTWPELAMKRMIRWAAENGFDRIAWTTGEQQADRYDLSKYVDSLAIKRRADDSGWNIAGDKGGVGVVGQDVRDLAGLDDVIGKELAAKTRTDLSAPGMNEYEGVTYRGLDLKVGGEGMKAFYDVQLPRVANDIGKKYGAKAGETVIDVGEWSKTESNFAVYEHGRRLFGAMTRERAERWIQEENEGRGDVVPSDRTENVPVHSLDIPPAMAESARSVGQPLFVLRTRKFAQRAGLPSIAPPLITPTQQQAADQVHAWVSRTGKPVETTHLRDKAAIAIHKIVRHWADDQIAVKELRDEAMVGRSLALNVDPYKLMQAFTFASTAMARDAIDHGVWSLETGHRLGPESPVEAFKILDTTGGLSADRIAQFADFVAAQTALERMENSKDAKGKIRYNPGIDPENAENSYLAAQSVVQQYANTPGFADASRIFTTFHKNLVHMVAEIGRLSPEAEKAIIDILPAYMPLMRVLEEYVPGKGKGGKRGVANVPNPVKHQTKRGGPQQVFDPVAQTLRMAEQFYMAATQVRAARAIVDTGLTSGSDLVEQVAAPTETIKLALQKLPQPIGAAGANVPGPVGTDIQRIAAELKDAGFQLDDAGLTALVSITRATQFYRGSEPIIAIFRNGQPEWYKLHPDLYTAVAGMEQVGLGFGLDGTLAGKAITGATKVKRLGATELRASFGLMINALRDFVTHPIRTEGFSPTAPIRELAAIVHQLASFVGELSGKGEDPIVALFRQYGGELSGFIGQDAHSMYRTMRDVMRTAQGREAEGIIIHPIDAVRAAFSFFEKSPRLAEFEMLLKRFGYTREMLKQGVIPPPALVAEAMFGAQNVTTNFRRAGTVGRVLNKVSAYQNARIQDVVEDWRLVRSHPMRTMLRGFAWLTVPSLFYWMKVKDEDWYRKLPAYRRFGGWNFRIGDDIDGTTLTIPTPFTLGMVFGMLPVAIMDTMYAKRLGREDPNRVKQWVGEVLPSPSGMLPDVAEPAFEVLLANKSIFTGKPVVSEELAGREPEDQYYDYTTSASKCMGWLMGVSPAKIDYLIKSYTGGLGTDILSIPDQGVGRALGYGRVLRNREETDSVNDFYAKQTEVNQAYNSALFHARADSNTPEEARVDDEDLVRQRYLMQQMASLMSDVRKLYKGESNVAALNQKNRLLTGLADVGAGKETLAMFPSIFETTDLPYDVRKIREKYIGLKLWQATSKPAPKRRGEKHEEYARRTADLQREQMLARDMLKAIGVSASEYRELLNAEAKRRGYNTTGPSYTTRLRELRNIGD